MTQQAAPRDPTTDGDGQDAIDRFFEVCRRSGLARSDDGRWLGGVCSGLADRWAVDPLIVRAGFILAVFIGGIGAPVYLVAWSLLPDPSGEISAEKAIRHGHLPSILLCIATVLVAFSGFGAFWSFSPAFGLGMPIVLIALVCWAVSAWSGRGPAARWHSGPTGAWTRRPGEEVHPASDGPSPGNQAARTGAAIRAAETSSIDVSKDPRPGARIDVGSHPAASADGRARRRGLGAATTLGVLGVSILAAALTGALLAATSHGDSALPVGLAAGVAVTALALILGGLAGRRGGGLATLATVFALIAVAGAVVIPRNMPWTGAIGDQTWRPTSVSDGTRQHFAMRVGDGTLDLSGVAAGSLARDVELTARVNVGRLEIVAPPGVRLRVQAAVDTGAIVVDRPGTAQDTERGGLRTRQTIVVGDGTRTVDVRAQVGVGNITVQEQR